MGYNINIVQSDAVLPEEHLDEAYRRLCALRRSKDLQTGGSFEPGKGQTRWFFAWMPEDYDEQCDTAREILEMSRFETEIVDGDLHIVSYDSKMGDEEHFLHAIGNLMTGQMEWLGEDGARWAYRFGPDGMEVGYAQEVVYDF